MANGSLKATIAGRKFILAPGVFDLISALIADRMEFPALYVSGYGRRRSDRRRRRSLARATGPGPACSE